MTRRMFLAVPSDPIVEGNGITFLPGGLMVDLTADIRCATCKWWLENEHGRYCAGTDCYTEADYGCTEWDAPHE